MPLLVLPYIGLLTLDIGRNFQGMMNLQQTTAFRKYNHERVHSVSSLGIFSELYQMKILALCLHEIFMPQIFPYTVVGDN